MNPTEQLQDIVGQLRNLMTLNRDLGLDPPVLAPSTLEYLTGPPTSPMPFGPLEKRVAECKKCNLWKERKNPVFGEGDPKSRLVFIGEGPGYEEDLAGRPFVGDAGKLLTDIIEKGMGLTRKQVYICNIVKCRPPGNRDPERDEMDACMPYLTEQLNRIKPEVICTLGRIAARELIGREFKITEERGNWFSYKGIPLIPTYHPAYILRNPGRTRELKGQVWQDIQAVMMKLGLEVKR
jgi:DNA polymerase